MESLFIEELDGPTFATHKEHEEWWTFESPYALEQEMAELRETVALRIQFGNVI